MYLGIETSSAASSVALLNEQGIYNELTVQAGLTHSEQLVPNIDLLLKQSNVTKADLKGVAVSIGPGSFTGLRIGMGTAKALAYALRIPLVGVMTMDAMARNFYNVQGVVSIMIDAQKKQVYEARYSWKEGQLVALSDPEVKPREAALEDLNALGVPVIVAGDGIVKIKDSIEETYQNITVAPPTLILPRASSIVLEALPKLEAGVDENDRLVPYYMRRSEAEVLWDQRHPSEAAAADVKEPTVIVTEVASQIKN
ncbi:MAG: tRNA (adenosine(37)-N6)-threonylcarbamoyltransferase complex dimerization subunit type 1 TsaB [Veillonella sp.]|uniref:tRNA (adenosine(37)-N6)-threonylcarbamoyltransferase complex dimerization subunit type 1 TsaB n=1 Tax=Veillonella sp. TaxID=1926307 RepID=UPI0025DA0DAB|nr:tRNA (adenosine(37)-N6)-threonylcarbamoyltransferase complex dimerization subunit type 1 TsaB [Veillonella sp.]MBS4912722.1 tRNA (adenosine(37)-N6)-threonylcarbamoyltransferase complex dimerization subunit type 1 TsaB [Veillonella sp.]